MLNPLLRTTTRYVEHATLFSSALLGMFCNQSSKRVVIPRTEYQVSRLKWKQKSNLWTVGFFMNEVKKLVLHYFKKILGKDKQAFDLVSNLLASKAGR